MELKVVALSGDGSGFWVQYSNCQHISFSFIGIRVVGYLCVFGFVPLCLPLFFIPFGLFCVLTIVILDSVILVFRFGCKVTLGVPSP